MADNRTLAKLLGSRFVQRRDVKAVQQADGSYRPDRSKFTLADIEAHLAGERTLGHYLVDPDGKCRLFAYDIDLAKEGRWRPDPNVDYSIPIAPRDIWAATDDDSLEEIRADLREQMVALAHGLAQRTHRLTDLPVAISYSGAKGVHVYCFTGEIEAAEAREAAIEILDSFSYFAPHRGKNFYRHEFAFPSLEIEVFPKQDEVRAGDGLGNLMRLPLGVHRRSGSNGFFLDVTQGWQEADAESVLRNGCVL